ncbi:uncharacterized protein LOC129607296 [Condylostylus longicornis]|uniref:uncharacterized protein LOC129607296 n=1 Tax=Condylostylus longicornis TaxID=2530218 RepID=UPI00244DD441|nr:uncharacterized protein LOC129607296 [Condylostylus longicornis]
MSFRKGTISFIALVFVLMICQVCEACKARNNIVNTGGPDSYVYSDGGTNILVSGGRGPADRDRSVPGIAPIGINNDIRGDDGFTRANDGRNFNNDGGFRG